MNRVRVILLFILACMSVSLMYAQDDVRLSEREIMGTARYVGMSGAMTAVGGDPSAVNTNPAGLGVYRRSEVLVTMDYQHDCTMQQGDDSIKQKNGLFMSPQVSFIVALGDPNEDKGVISNNLMISYSRLRSYSRSYDIVSGADYSMGELLQSSGIDLGMDYPAYRYNEMSRMKLRESGYVNQYNLDWAINISHRLYIGAGLRMTSYRLAAEADYYERFSATNASGDAYDLENENSVILNGVGFGGALGIIYRPSGWVRLGAAIESPTVNTVRMYSSGTMSSMTDSLRYSYAPSGSARWTDYHAPLKTSVGAALQVGDYGLLSLQYDYSHLKGYDDLHALRAGLEVVPVPGLYLNAGYSYESTFKKTCRAVGFDPVFERQDMHYVHPVSTQYASGAIGYRGQFFSVQVAYQYRWQQLHLHTYETATAAGVNADTHRVVLTLGWHN